MEVHLYVYDLTRGMARSMSRQLLGIQVDAVYHTSLVLENIEYFFGRGVQTCYAGTTHHGRPMEIISMGTTHLPLDTILEYLESLKDVYSPESYDLFAHNCNNFTNDFGMFLVGKGIPDHITNLPRRVLDTPFGQMLKPQIDESMRSITQAPVAPPRRTPGVPSANGTSTVSLQNLPTLQFGSLKPVTYAKVPPLNKLMAKLGPASSEQELVALRSFMEKRNQDPRNAALPNLQAIGATFQSKVLALPLEVRFAAIDLLRCAMIDARVSGYFAEEPQMSTIQTLVRHVNDLESCPHNVRLVTIHLACNLFGSTLFVKEIMKAGNPVAAKLVQLVTSSLLDASHPITRVAAASLAFNLATANYRIRREEQREALGDAEQLELAASLIETLSREENSDATKALLLSIGYLLYCAPREGEVMDVARALDARAIISATKGHETLAKEITSLL